MRILVTGGSGQFGHAFGELCRRQGHALTMPGHAEMPVEDAARVEGVVARERPDWLVHAAARTDVDACERDPTGAHALNALGSQHVAQAAARHGARLVVVSTDYVYDGEHGPYREGDPTGPLSAYGRSKLEGERLAQAALPSTCIARTSVVFGPSRNNFVLWVLRSLREGKPVRAARDQWVTPTAAHDLARQVLALVEAQATGIYHTAGAERLSRLEMAHRIARHHGLDPGGIESVRMADLTWLAPRPRDASLLTDKVAQLCRPLDFDQALATLAASPA